jgi:hypothetical protein
VHSRLVQWPATAQSATAMSTSVVRVAGLDANGALGVVDLDVAASVAGGDASAALVTKDWPVALALRLDDNGDPVPFDP